MKQREYERFQTKRGKRHEREKDTRESFMVLSVNIENIIRFSLYSEKQNLIISQGNKASLIPWGLLFFFLTDYCSVM